MKPPSKNISKSLSKQRPGGRGPQKIEVSGLNYRAPAMVVPGEGGTVRPPGAARTRAPQDTAAVFGLPNAKKMGGKTD